MRLYPRSDRLQLRLGNVLPDVSGEIEAPAELGQGTGTHRPAEPAEPDEIPTARHAALRPRKLPR
jgi:hypothetical protein